MASVEQDHGLVTVGIPTYNRPEGLRKTLACITSQTYENLEIVVSDNASDDPESCRVVEEFARNDPRVRYHRQVENIGASRNFQYVLDKARGDYFMWAADDDLWETDFIQSLVSMLALQPSAVAAFSDIGLIDHTGPGPVTFEYRDLCLSSCSAYQRVRDYVRLREGVLGKASLIYALHRTRILRATGVAQILLSCPWAGDAAAVQALLLEGPFLCSGRSSYYLSQRNAKYYEATGRVRGRRSLFELLPSLMKLLKQRHIYFKLCRRLVFECHVLGVSQRMVLAALLTYRQAGFWTQDLSWFVKRAAYRLAKSGGKRLISRPRL